MLKIRLQRVGRKHEPTFRVVLTDSKNSTKSGKFHEVLGSYDPRKKGEVLSGDRIKEWMSKGAQLSGTVHNLLISHKIIEGKKMNVLPHKKPFKSEAKLAEEKAAADAEAARVAAEKAAAEAEKAEAEAAAAKEVEEKAAAEAAAAAPAPEEVPVAEVAAEPNPETPAEEATPTPEAETPTEAPVEEVKTEEAPAA